MIEYCKSETSFVKGDVMNIEVENENFTHNIWSGWPKQNEKNENIGEKLRDKIIQIITSDEKFPDNYYFKASQTHSTVAIFTFRKLFSENFP